jgi:uncharacterized membrane protein
MATSDRAPRDEDDFEAEPKLIEDQRSPRKRRATARRMDNDGHGVSRTLIGLGLAAAGAGAAIFFAKKAGEASADDHVTISDAPDHVLRNKDRARAGNVESGRPLVGRTVTIGKPKEELYARWRDFTRFPEFMDNVREIVTIDEQRSKWTIEAPFGATVSVLTRIVEEVPGKTIAWVSEPESQISTEGRVEFADAPPGRGTYVRLVMRYTPPAGGLGRAVAKLFQREPEIQARRDLRRFKQLIETGEVSVNASPSGRKSESPTEARI